MGAADSSIVAEDDDGAGLHGPTPPRQTVDKPPVDNMLSLFDIEAVARTEMMAKNPQVRCGSLSRSLSRFLFLLGGWGVGGEPTA